MLNLSPNELPMDKSTVEVVEAGVYPAVISLIVDLGIQKQKKFDSKDKPDDKCTQADWDVSRQIWYSFTLPTERFEVETDGEVVLRDQILGKMYKVSRSDKSNLMKMYKSVVKDGRSLGDMVGMPVTVTTGITSGGKARVDNVAPPMRGSSVDAPLNEPMVVSEAHWDTVDDLLLPEFIKEMIKNRVQ